MKNWFFIISGFLFITLSLPAQVPAGYYDMAIGKTGEELRVSLHTIISSGHVKLPYTSTSFDVWDAMAITDVFPPPDTTFVWDMYSDIPGGTPAYTYTIYTDQCGTASKEGDCYSREHMMPKSWWGGYDNLSNPQYTDLHMLFPSDQYVNNRKSAHVVAETTSPTWTSTNGSKVGPCSFPGYTGVIFEPIDEYKGDFARAFLYIAVRYMDKMSTWINEYPSTEGQFIISPTGGNYKQWYINLLLSWHIQDTVSQKEIDRNNKVYYNTPQHNRNPFIDHPGYVSQIWNSSNGIIREDSTDHKTLVKLYPNPVSEILTIELENEDKEIKYEILTLHGKLLSQGLILHKTTIQTAHLARGLYLVKFRHTNSSTSVKFLKN